MLVPAAVAIYHLFVENSVVPQSQVCRLSAPGGCATKWITMSGYITIPTLALTGFLLLIAALLAATFDPHGGDTLEEPAMWDNADPETEG